MKGTLLLTSLERLWHTAPADLWERLLPLLGYDPAQPLLFNSALFLFALALFYIGYALLTHRRHTALRLLYVTLFSYWMYYRNAGPYILLLALLTIAVYLLAIGMDRQQRQGPRRAWLVVCVLLLLGGLAYFKYTAFFLTSILPLFTGQAHEGVDLLVPLGISFYTFQTLSYVVDVYRRQMPATRRLLDFAFFVSFFPTLLSGPILRARTFLPQLRARVEVTREMFGAGLWMLFTGLFKKCVLSDYIGENFVNRVFDNPALYTGIENLAALYGYTLKIYCDFSGYSDMAIGLALWMGLSIPDNFRAPYKSYSITDFWRRWHISLSFWLRDYLYIPLGGNRCKAWRMYANQMITMLLGGLWHGASWNFLVWGGAHGLALCVHKTWRRLLHRDKHYEPRGLRRFCATLLTFHVVALCWLFFANSTFQASITMLSKIGTELHPELLPQFLAGYPAVVSLIVLGYVLHFLPTSWNDGTRCLICRAPFLVQLLLMAIAILLVMQVMGSDVQPFIYLQF